MVILEINPTNYTYPFECDFGDMISSNEYDFYICGMFQDTRAGALWRVGSGSTPTLFTGPAAGASSAHGLKNIIFKVLPFLDGFIIII